MARAENQGGGFMHPKRTFIKTHGSRMCRRLYAEECVVTHPGAVCIAQKAICASCVQFHLQYMQLTGRRGAFNTSVKRVTSVHTCKVFSHVTRVASFHKCGVFAQAWRLLYTCDFASHVRRLFTRVTYFNMCDVSSHM